MVDLRRINLCRLPRPMGQLARRWAHVCVSLGGSRMV